MGLDVYLYRYENKEVTDRKESEFETASNQNWEAVGDYKTLTDAQKNEVREKNLAVSTSLGLDEWGSDETEKKKIEINSAIDPEHYFKIGYFRSSYNGSGINRVLSNLGVPDLYEIFEPNDEYCFQPNWKEVIQRANAAIELLSQKGNYKCFSVDENVFGNNTPPQSEKEALEILQKEIADNKSTFEGGYENGKGSFYLNEPLEVVALIPGINNILRPRNCTYVIIKGDIDWYITALKIVRETCEYVLAQNDPQKYWLHWSG